MTPDSSPVSYLSPQDFVNLKDSRSIAEYSSDDPKNPIDPNTLVSNPPVTMMAAIDAASGMLESAVLRSTI